MVAKQQDTERIDLWGKLMPLEFGHFEFCGLSVWIEPMDSWTCGVIFLGEVRAGDVFLGFISISVVIKTM